MSRFLESLLQLFSRLEGVFSILLLKTMVEKAAISRLNSLNFEYKSNCAKANFPYSAVHKRNVINYK